MSQNSSKPQFLQNKLPSHAHTVRGPTSNVCLQRNRHFLILTHCLPLSWVLKSMSSIEVTHTTIENMHKDWAPGPSGRGFWNILDDYDSAATVFCVNGRNFLSHNLFTSSANIFPSDYLRAEDSDTGPLIRLITYPCGQNGKEIIDAYG